MSKSIEFTKLSGSGNDFICIDNRHGRFDKVISSNLIRHFVRTLCRRGLGVGADGVIFAENSDVLGDVDVFARFFEPDGSEAELCGNGAACFVCWVISNGWTTDGEIKVLTAAGVVKGRRLDGRYVRVCIPLPEEETLDLALTVDGRTFQCDYLLVGVPHLVTYVDDVDSVDVARWGRLLRCHGRFGDRGTNVNFVQVMGQGEIAVRTFEFGVEAETLSCGTGSAAAAILTAKRSGWPRGYFSGDERVRVRTRGGDVMKVRFTVRDNQVTDVCLETVVRCVYSGIVSPQLAEEALSGKPGRCCACKGVKADDVQH